MKGTLLRGITRTDRLVDLVPGTSVKPTPHNDGDLQSGHVRAHSLPKPGDTIRYRTVALWELTGVITWAYETADGYLCGWVITERLWVL